MSLSQKETAEYASDLQVGLNGTDVPEFDAARLLGNAAVAARHFGHTQNRERRFPPIAAPLRTGAGLQLRPNTFDKEKIEVIADLHIK